MYQIPVATPHKSYRLLHGIEMSRFIHILQVFPFDTRGLQLVMHLLFPLSAGISRRSGS